MKTLQRRLVDWIEHRTGLETGRQELPVRGDSRLQRLAPGLRQRGRVSISGPSFHGLAPCVQLCPHAR